MIVIELHFSSQILEVWNFNIGKILCGHYRLLGYSCGHYVTCVISSQLAHSVIGNIFGQSKFRKVSGRWFSGRNLVPGIHSLASLKDPYSSITKNCWPPLAIILILKQKNPSF